ncbi:hypothetical protein [Nostoc sp.]|uniref:hypothetical protein n=1 Tax=Nostoc sp. TaxID=1180 RepID=UPI002FF9778E
MQIPVAEGGGGSTLRDFPSYSQGFKPSSHLLGKGDRSRTASADIPGASVCISRN